MGPARSRVKRFLRAPPVSPIRNGVRLHAGATVDWSREGGTPLRSLALPAVVVTALAVALPAALTSSMHPRLAARLAGMGEHGGVNIQVKAQSKQLCWTFDLPTTKGIT